MTETVLRLAPGDVILAGGKFNARNRYMRSGLAGALFPLVKGPTLLVKSNAAFAYPSIVYECDGYTKRQTQRWAGPTVSPDAAPAGAFTALFTLVRIT